MRLWLPPPGYLCRWPLAGVAAAIRTAGLPLLVDEAHGGHLRYLDRPIEALAAGAGAPSIILFPDGRAIAGGRFDQAITAIRTALRQKRADREFWKAVPREDGTAAVMTFAGGQRILTPPVALENAVALLAGAALTVTGPDKINLQGGATPSPGPLYRRGRRAIG